MVFWMCIAQDGSGTNNAMFACPPDGKTARLFMFLFTLTKTPRDGALVNDIIIHEVTHGLSTRLTGGPTLGNCLQTVIIS
jgi:extracellular elastinolytic metalloproteinase